MIQTDTGKIPRFKGLLSLLLTAALCVLSAPLLARDDTNDQAKTFPDTDALLATVVQRERAAELELQSLVFKDAVTVSAFDATGQLHATRTDTRYFNAFGYHPFAVHMTTNGKSLNIPFSEILARSRLVPLQWSELDGTPVIVFSFEPQSSDVKHGDVESRLAGDLKGTIWVTPSDPSIVRFEFHSVRTISLAWGFEGSIDSVEGLVQMQKGASNLWLPARQQLVTRGKNNVVVVAGLRFSKRFRTQQTDEMSTYAPDIDVIRAQPSSQGYGD